MMRYLTLLILAIPVICNAAPPVLHFSDIISGPKTGNSDTLGSGVIVTIWGNNLGSNQGASKVSVGSVEATQVYTWKNADGNLPGGPADLFTYHKMQEVSFAVPAGATDGENAIKVTVGGEDSNTLPFTIRPGNIYFIKSTGNDTTGDGSWSSPWLTLSNVMSGNGKLSAGDTVYTVGVGSSAGVTVGNLGGGLQGTADNPFSLIAYPNTLPHITGFQANNYTIFNYNFDTAAASKYINFSKLKLTVGLTSTGTSAGIRAFEGNRIVGIEITGPTAYGGTTGAIGGNRAAAGGGKYLGVYIHDYGTANSVASVGNTGTDTNSCSYVNPECMSSWDVYQHLYYLSNRYAGSIPAYEIGWNHLADNPIYQGIHVYDESSAGGWSGTMKFHNNVVKNQRGGAIELDLPATITVPFEIYNNLVISDIDDVYNLRALQLKAVGSSVKVYNNTIYGYNASNVLDYSTQNTDFRNNIIVDTKGIDFETGVEPNTHSNNLFYSSGSVSQPSWAASESGNIAGNPLFKSASTGDFSLQVLSPAKNSGYDTTSVVARDFLGQPRTGTPSIGAFEFSGFTNTGISFSGTIFSSRATGTPISILE